MDDRQQVIGWPGDPRQLEALTSKIVNNLRTQPSSVRVEEVQGVKILVIDMLSSSIPVAYHGHYYRRIGNTTQEIAPEELGYFLMQRSGTTWDALPSAYQLEEIDREQIANFIQLAKARLPHISATETSAALLQKLKLLTGNQPNQAAILLFGKIASLPVLMPQIHMGRFKDPITIIDNRFISGTLFQQLEQVMQLFTQYLQVRYEIPTQTDGKTGIEILQRREIWDYPLDALREAVINALIHRDYISQAHITIRVYDDEVIISNPGTLPKELTIEDLKRETHESYPRNPLLAQLFYYASLVESWGSGTTRMRHACQAQGLPEPEFAVTGNQFSITFRQQLTDNELLAQGLNARQITAIHYLREHHRIDNKTYRELNDITRNPRVRNSMS